MYNIVLEGIASSQTGKSNKRCVNWKERKKTVIICGYNLRIRNLKQKKKATDKVNKMI